MEEKHFRLNIIFGDFEGVHLNKDHISLLYINGSFYEMWLELGSLIREEFEINYRAFSTFYNEMGISKNDLIQLWKKQESYVPQEAKDYIQGYADALNLTFQDIACVWVAEGGAYSHR